MAKFQSLSLLAASLCLMSLLRLAYSHNYLTVQGKIYCDNCRVGFETRVSEHIAGAKARVECKDRKAGLLTYTIEGATDATGTYRIPVEGDHQEEICEVVPIYSPMADCNEIESGRDRVRVHLTKNNGIVSDTRYANSLGFMKKEALPICSEILKEYGLLS